MKSEMGLVKNNNIQLCHQSIQRLTIDEISCCKGLTLVVAGKKRKKKRLEDATYGSWEMHACYTQKSNNEQLITCELSCKSDMAQMGFGYK